MVAAAKSSTTTQVTRRAVTRATLQHKARWEIKLRTPPSTQHLRCASPSNTAGADWLGKGRGGGQTGNVITGQPPLHQLPVSAHSLEHARGRARLLAATRGGWGGEDFVSSAHLPPALVSPTASGLGTFGLTQVFFVTGHQLPVFATPARLLHHLRGQGGRGVSVGQPGVCVCVCHLSAGLTAPSMTPH